jgi:hypothetical protein
MAIKKDDNTPAGNAAREAIAKQQREHRRRNRGDAEASDWSNADAGKLHAVICSLTGAGCAVQFGYTKDGGSFVIRIVGDGEPYNEYVRPTESIDEYLDGLARDFSK